MLSLRLRLFSTHIDWWLESVHVWLSMGSQYGARVFSTQNLSEFGMVKMLTFEYSNGTCKGTWLGCCKDSHNYTTGISPTIFPPLFYVQPSMFLAWRCSSDWISVCCGSGWAVAKALDAIVWCSLASIVAAAMDGAGVAVPLDDVGVAVCAVSEPGCGTPNTCSQGVPVSESCGFEDRFLMASKSFRQLLEAVCWVAGPTDRFGPNWQINWSCKTRSLYVTYMALRVFQSCGNTFECWSLDRLRLWEVLVFVSKILFASLICFSFDGSMFSDHLEVQVVHTSVASTQFL